MNFNSIRDFCESSTPKDKTFLGLWQKDPSQEGAKNLLSCFGRLQATKISESLSPEQEVFKKVNEAQLEDFALLLNQNKAFTLGKNRNFLDHPDHSWNQVKTCTTITSGKQHAEKLKYEFIAQEPMPILFAQALGLDSKFLEEKFKAQAEEINKVARTLFLALKNPPPSKGLLESPYGAPQVITQFQLMLLKYAAVNEGDHLNSWLDEMILWGAAGNLNVTLSILKSFKVCHLMDAVKQSFNFHSPKFKNPPRDIKYDNSFRDYLIKKTLDQIISFSPIPDNKYRELFKEFKSERGEESRQLVCFYFHLLKRLFAKSESKLPYCSPEILDLAAEKPKEPLVQQALNILNRICPTESIVKDFLILLTHAFEFEYQSNKEMTQEIRAKLIKLLFFSPFKRKHLDRVIEFILNTLPFSTRLSLLKELNNRKNAEKVFTLLRMCMIELAFCRENFYDPQDPFKDHLIPQLKKYNLMSPLYLNIVDYLHALFYIDLTEDAKELLYNQLLEANETEKDLYRKELKAYGESIGFFKKRTIHENRQDYFCKIYSDFLQQNKNVLELKTVIQKPDLFKKFDINVKLIQELEKFLKKNLPIKIFINLLLYPVFLSPVLDLLTRFSNIQNEISKYIDYFFIPPSLVKEIKALDNVFQRPNAFISSILKDEHASFLPTHLSTLSHIIQSTLLHAPTYRTPILESCEIFSEEEELTEKELIFSNHLFPLSGIGLQKVFCLLHWDLSDNYPVLELTFIQPAKDCASKKLSFTLEIDKEELVNKSALRELLKKAFNFCDEVEDESLENRLKKSRPTLEEELEWCCAINKEFNDAYEHYWQKYGTNETFRKGKAVIKFVKAIKIFSREVLFKSTPDQEMTVSEKTPLIDVIKQGNIYTTPTGLTLIPPSFPADIREKYQLKNSEFIKEFQNLCAVILEDSESEVPKPFCELVLGGEKYPVEVTVRKLDLSEAKIKLEFKKSYRELKFILGTTPPIDWILVLPEIIPDEPANLLNPDFSRLKGFSNPQELNNLLRWGLLSLIRKYYNVRPSPQPKPLQNRLLNRVREADQMSLTRPRSHTISD